MAGVAAGLALGLGLGLGLTGPLAALVVSRGSIVLESNEDLAGHTNELPPKRSIRCIGTEYWIKCANTSNEGMPCN